MWGGGYTPGSQGKDHVDGRIEGSAKLSQIPLIDMHYEALKAGVPLMTLEELQRHRPETFRHFACHPQLIADYNAWLATHGVRSQDKRTLIQRHCEQYVTWKGLRLREGSENLIRQPFYLRAHREDQDDLRKAQRHFNERVVRYVLHRRNIAAHREWERTRTTYYPPVADRNAWGEPASARVLTSAAISGRSGEGVLSPALVRLFDNYVHDSIAGFYIRGWTELDIPVVSTLGYLSYREVALVNSREKKAVCNPPMPAGVPLNTPTIGQAFDALGRSYR